MVLVVCSPVKGGDIEDCENGETRLRTEPVRVSSACRRLAERGYAWAQFNLGLMYAEGFGVPQNNTEAVKWYRLAAEQGEGRAQNNLGFMYLKGRGVPEDYVKAYMWFSLSAANPLHDYWDQAIANRDHAAGIMSAGQIAKAQEMAASWAARQEEYQSPLDETLETEKARRLPSGGDVEDCANDEALLKTNPSRVFVACRRLADQGHAWAQRTLGFMYANGLGVPRDYEEAVKWTSLAAQSGDAIAQFNLGVTYDKGRGLPRNDSEAVRWYRLAAEQGYGPAQLNLGIMYADGRGLPQNDVEAVRWYRLAAEQGDGHAQLNLGIMYAVGRGVPQNDSDAAKWYRLAAKQGVAAAQYNLGLMHDEGRGVPQNDVEAVAWYRAAAEEGYGPAQNNLGAMYAEGRGVPQDYVRAYMWLDLSAAGPHESQDVAIRNRERLASIMTKDQIAKAREMATSWAAWHERYHEPLDQVPEAVEAPKWARETIVQVQAALAGLGYDPGSIDGVLGQRTRAAIRAYQRDAGLPEDGEITNTLIYSLQTNAEQIQKPPPERSETASVGSGFIVNFDGDVLTNHHVVADCEYRGDIRVLVPGVSEQSAKLVGFNESNDLAVVRLGHRTSWAATFRGDSEIRQGDEVVVVGYPLYGLLASGTNVTSGMVSATAGIRGDNRHLQITAPVQPGNSGGPLLDLSGNVVGIVVSKLPLAVAEVTGDVPENVNFAIKQSIVRQMLDAFTITYATAPSRERLSVADVAERANRFTVVVGCVQ